jgi:hypothetical protein
MNTKFTKVMPVLLAVVAVLAISTFQVFAHNPSENESATHRSSSSSMQIEDRGTQSSVVETGEDFSFSGIIEAMSATSITIGGKTVVVNASTLLDSGLVVGAEARVEVIQQADGSLLAKEIETDNENEVEHLNGDDHGHGTEMGDDHGANSGSNDSHGSGSGSSDDNSGTSGSSGSHGGNSGSGSSGGADDHGGNSGKGKSGRG